MDPCPCATPEAVHCCATKACAESRNAVANVASRKLKSRELRGSVVPPTAAPGPVGTRSQMDKSHRDLRRRRTKSFAAGCALQSRPCKRNPAALLCWLLCLRSCRSTAPSVSRNPWRSAAHCGLMSQHGNRPRGVSSILNGPKIRSRIGVEISH